MRLRQSLGVMLPLLLLTGIAAAESRSARIAQVWNVGVVRGSDGLDIEISGNAPLRGRAMKLSDPDRVVVDIRNATPATRHRHIRVNAADVVGVRIAQFKQNPPVTRVVVDLTGAQDYQLVSSGSMLTLKLRPPSAGASSAISTREQAARGSQQAQPAASPSSAPLQAKSFVYLQPEFHRVSAAISEEPAATAAPAQNEWTVKPMGGETAVGAAMPKPAAAVPLQPAVNMAAMQQQMAQQQPATRPRYTGEPISVNLKDVDLRDFFRLIHEISGLNVVLDPNVRGGLTIVLEDVPWDQALDIVLRNNQLERQLEGNVLRIATTETVRKEAEARRAQVEAQALAADKVTVTRFLSYAHSKDVVTTVKGFLSQRGEIIADERTNALIISDIPSVIPQIDSLLTQLDRKTQEVEIEARVVAATRNFARDIGTQLGFGWGNNPTAIGGASSVGSSPVSFGGLNPLFLVVPTDSIPLFSNLPVQSPTSGITFTNATNNYRIDFILTMAESRGLLKILSRPRVVTQNNIQAQVRQGVRVPIVTAAQLGGPPTVTYVDAFLRLTVTPQITAEGTIFLNVDVENTVPDFANDVQGNPTLITQQATTQVLVNDGGTVMIGGVIQTQNNVAVNQVPFLGDIPILGNLFKRRSVSTSTQELIFFITPKIVQT